MLLPLLPPLLFSTLAVASGVGWMKYNELVEGKNNAGVTAFTKPKFGATTAFLYVNLLPQRTDHTQIIADFHTFVDNYSQAGVSIIPRIRYVDTEAPADVDALMRDVRLWAGILQKANAKAKFPVVQAGFLGRWGEWHGTPFSKDIKIKGQVAQALVDAGLKVALRYPPDHYALYPNSRLVTLHNDCIFDAGYDGTDGGTYVGRNDDDDDDENPPITDWRAYSIKVAHSNNYGGEGCDNAGESSDAKYYSNYDLLCDKTKGLAAYLRLIGVQYLNYEFPTALTDLIQSQERPECIADIEAALKANAAGTSSTRRRWMRVDAS